MNNINVLNKMNHFKILIVCILLIFDSTNLVSQSIPQITRIETNEKVSIRGISIPSPGTIWVSGSNGYIGLSKDTGQSYIWNEVNKYNKLDFRDIYALNDSETLIINSGSPAFIYKTYNGGKDWKEVYRNDSKGVFFNGFDFWDKQHGIAFSDPLMNKLLILTTHDGGESWQEPDSISIPECFQNEAGFASSGSSIYCGIQGHVLIGTGGSHARLFVSNNYGVQWDVIETPMKSGKESTGIFSVMEGKNGNIFIAGGDYKNDSLSESNFFFIEKGSMEWNQPDHSPSGFCSSMVLAENKDIIITGTRGTEISTDAGITWKHIDSHPYYVAATCNTCNYILLAGANGHTAILKISD